MWAAVEAVFCFSEGWLVSARRGRCNEIWCIQIVLAGNPHQGEEAVAPGIGEGRTHAMWRRGIADGADWPVRGNPFSRGMGQDCAKSNDAGSFINRGGLHRRDLMLAQRLPHDVESAGQWGITEGPPGLCCSIRSYGPDQ